MTKTLFLAFISFLIPFLSFSQTQVSGNIQKNTTWTKANGPYVLTGTVGVPSAYTLTIEPGVTIQRTADYQILINGAVIINGVKSDSITFSSGASISKNSKPFIEFRKSNLDNSSIKFVKFINQSGNGYNIRMGDEDGYSQPSPKNSGTLKISRSNLSNGYTATKGYFAAISMNIDSCVLKNATVYTYPLSEEINISNSTLTRSLFDGAQTNLGISISKCTIDSTDFKGALYLTFMSSKVRNSSIFNSGGDSLKIENSIFLNTPFTLLGIRLFMKNSKYIITDTSLALNPMYSQRGKNYVIITEDAIMQGCELIGVPSYSCLLLIKTSDRIWTTTFSNNNFSDFQDYIAVHKNQSTPSIYIDNNNFNSTSNYAIANYTLTDIPATGNYFELQPGQRIDDIIFDGNDDLTYGLVKYASHSATPIATAAVSRPKNATKELVNGKVVVRWNKSTEANVTNYKVCVGYVDPFTYSTTTTVAATDTFLVLSGASITDSIAVTASKVIATGRGNEQVVYESWFSPAVFRTSVLPVKLITFNAVSLDNKTQLLWETASEVFNDHFDIEYSTDGISFTKIGTIPAAITSSNRNRYSFIHNTPSDGVNFYRLKQVDRDGHVEYSNIIQVKASVKKRIHIYPNPATETINIVSGEAIVNATLINELGQNIKKINGGNVFQLKVNISNLPKGVYRILIENQNRETDNISFIKQ